MSRLWIPTFFALGLACLAAGQLLDIPMNATLKSILAGIGGVVSATVLFALWKIEEDVRKAREHIDRKIDAQTQRLEAEIDAGDDLLYQLFSAFRAQLGDKQFEATVGKLVLKYPELKRIDTNHLIAHLALQELEKLSESLERYEYETDVYDVIDLYPAPFYKAAWSSIIATDIVTNGDTQWPRVHWDKMIDLNRVTLERMKSSLQHGAIVSIRRIFLLDDELSDDRREQTEELMNRLRSAGVLVSFISLSYARTLAQRLSKGEYRRRVRDAEDFSVFDASQGKLKYAGRFSATGAKSVVVTTDPVVVSELEQQFELLWDNATEYTLPPLEGPEHMWV